MTLSEVESAASIALHNKNALLKFITPNNVGLTGSHECGFYLPKPAWKQYSIFPPDKGKNYEQDITILWNNNYNTNSKIKWYGQGTRSEYRLTCFGKDFPFLKEECVGNLLVLIKTGHETFRSFVFDSEEDIENIQAALGVNVLESWGILSGELPEKTKIMECLKNKFEKWALELKHFPPTAEMSMQTLNSLSSCASSFSRWSSDKQLMELLDTEYSLFKFLETQFCFPVVKKGFSSIDDFISLATSMTQRRKARAGRSLENHVEHLLRLNGIPFDMRPRIDGNSEPDILIPGKTQYQDPTFPTEKLFMIGIKRTCKDRWRQVLNEAHRISNKHILTIQPGISSNQLKEMYDANISLIIPTSLHENFICNDSIEIVSIEKFITMVKERIGYRK